MNYNEKIVNQLQHLLQRNNDASQGFIIASNNISQTKLHNWLLDYSKKREKFSEDLMVEITKLGGNPDDSTTILAEMHQAWLDIKGDITSNDVETILDECLRGESYATEDYEEVLKTYKLSDSLESLLRKQLSTIKNTISELETLKKLYDAPVEIV